MCYLSNSIFSDEVRDLANLAKKTHDLNTLVKKNKKVFQLLREETSFITHSALARERLWYVENNTTLPPKCKMCNQHTKWDNGCRQFRTYCSVKCRSKDQKVIQRQQNTCELRYGTKYPMCSDDIKAKQKQTMLERYGVEHNWQKGGISRERIKQTMLERYGVEHNWNSDSPFREQQKQTMLERYGVEFAVQSNEIKERIRQTNLARYGAIHYNQARNIDAFNLLNDHDWLLYNYVILKKTSIQIANELNVHFSTVCAYLHNNDILIKCVAFQSYKAVQWLECIMKEENIFIQHSQNKGEYKIPNTRYFVDGYCKDTNTVYEFHGDLWHGNPQLFDPDEQCHPFNSSITAGELYQKTIKREDKLKELGYNVVTIWENEWEKIC